MKLTRADRSLLAEWWFTIDRTLLATLLALMAIGLALSLAASPAVALKKGLPPFYFAQRQFLFAAIGLVIILAVSTMSPSATRRLALVVLLASMALMAWAVVAGVEIKGARRWVALFGHSIQPSEFGKPALVVILAWLFAERTRRDDVPSIPLAIGLGGLFAGLLVVQPDVGQTILVAAVWCALFVLSGQPLRYAALFMPAGLLAFGGAWLAFPHVRSRVARFFDPASGDTYQTDRAVQSFAEGGLFGRGPGEGTIKSSLPDAHTDFIFAVIGEEYGSLACLGVLVLFMLVAVRALRFAWNEPEPFPRLAVIGLALLIVLQAAINMGVNVGILPAKGMTLPFISAGGSSSLSMSFAAGLLLALSRRRPRLAHVKKPQLGASMDQIAAR
ncbi:MAG: FtsW/RodA/SpoVE family cell cycle protein [Hyphomicrobiaceae bacterium]